MDMLETKAPYEGFAEPLLLEELVRLSKQPNWRVRLVCPEMIDKLRLPHTVAACRGSSDT